MPVPAVQAAPEGVFRRVSRRRTRRAAPSADRCRPSRVRHHQRSRGLPRREPTGWCAVEPRSHNEGLVRNNRVPWQGRDEDKSDDRVWAVTCFFIRRGFRKGGVSRALARAAVSFARDRGARAIEGYPIITTDVIMEELLVGTVMRGVPLLVSSRHHRRPVVLVSSPTSRHSASRTDEPAIRFDRARVVKVRSHSHGRLVQPPFRRRGRRDRAPTIVSILDPSGCCHSFAERPYTRSNRSLR